MIMIHLILVILLIYGCQSTVVINQITGLTSNNLMYTGTIQVNKEKLFFIYYGVDGQTSPDNLNSFPLFIAVGAPGRSAQYINLAGIGPKFLNKSLGLIDNPNRITQFANVLFLDLLGSGYSYVSSSDAIPKTSKQHGIIMTLAINSFINQTNIAKSKNIYLIAQSTFVRSLTGLDDIASLKGIIHVSAWYDLYEVGRLYGTGGMELKIFTDAERITIQSTFVNCYNMQKNSRFIQAHQCYDTTLNYVENKTKNRNLFNVQLQSNLTDTLPMIQYYFSQPSVITAYKAPNTGNLLFQAFSSQVLANLYQDLGRNYDTGISQSFRDYLSIKQIFITGDIDFITFRRSTRYWLQTYLSFVQSDKFKPLNLTEYVIDGKIVGYKKSVTQVAYYQILGSGHFVYMDQPAVIKNILKQLPITAQIQQQVPDQSDTNKKDGKEANLQIQ